jgi:hypothetical protein
LTNTPKVTKQAAAVKTTPAKKSNKKVIESPKLKDEVYVTPDDLEDIDDDLDNMDINNQPPASLGIGGSIYNTLANSLKK